MVKIGNGKFNYKFRFLCVSGTLGLDVSKAPWTEKVLGLNLTGPVFFSNRKKFRFRQNCRLIICLLMFCRLICHIVELFFFCSYIVVTLGVLIFSAVSSFLNLVFVFLFFRLKTFFCPMISAYILSA